MIEKTEKSFFFSSVRKLLEAPNRELQTRRTENLETVEQRTSRSPDRDRQTKNCEPPNCYNYSREDDVPARELQQRRCRNGEYAVAKMTRRSGQICAGYEQICAGEEWDLDLEI